MGTMIWCNPSCAKKRKREKSEMTATCPFSFSLAFFVSLGWTSISIEWSIGASRFDIARIVICSKKRTGYDRHTRFLFNKTQKREISSSAYPLSLARFGPLLLQVYQMFATDQQLCILKWYNKDKPFSYYECEQKGNNDREINLKFSFETLLIVAQSPFYLAKRSTNWRPAHVSRKLVVVWV